MLENLFEGTVGLEMGLQTPVRGGGKEGLLGQGVDALILVHQGHADWGAAGVRTRLGGAGGVRRPWRRSILPRDGWRGRFSRGRIHAVTAIHRLPSTRLRCVCVSEISDAHSHFEGC